MSPAPSPYAGTTPVASTGAPGGVVTLVEGQTFCLSDRAGDIAADLPHGLFVLDTRVVSEWELRLDGHALEALAVDVTDPFAATFVGRSRPREGQADADLVVFRHRRIGAGMAEDVVVTNHGLEATLVAVGLRCHVDFADLFEVKEGRVHDRAHGPVAATPSSVHVASRRGAVDRAVDIALTPPAVDVDPGWPTWRVALGPGESWALRVEVTVSVGGTAVEPRFRSHDEHPAALPARQLASWRATLPTVRADHPGLEQAVGRAGEDLGALRLFDPEAPEDPVVAAGAPWFMTLFGRDSLLTSWMTLLADPSLARGVLRTLARLQGTDVDPRSEEEPGKVLHEVRFGAAGARGLGRADAYFGSVDATPLFVMVLGELARWEGATDALVDLLPHADRALEWIRAFGDRDGDGYVEYERRNPEGLVNQGWKDSWDAVRHLDGSLAQGPIALCEVQGYTYAAYLARAHLARLVGDEPTAVRYLALAADLRRRFDEDFWVEEHGWYALGLDGDKRPIAALASNMGHCLWTGIVDPARAGAVAARLVSDELFSGWGVRTLAATMAAYNPVSYHNGSVWPHDNALCAAGLARYGHVEEAHRVIGAQLAVAEAHGSRLPELFAGFGREGLATPAAYPTSCSPQAWAAAAPLLWVRTLLRFDPSATEGEVALEPELPSWLRRLHVAGIAVAGEHLTVDVEGDTVEVSGAGRLRVVRRARPPTGPMVD